MCVWVIFICFYFIIFNFPFRSVPPNCGWGVRGPRGVGCVWGGRGSRGFLHEAAHFRRGVPRSASYSVRNAASGASAGGEGQVRAQVLVCLRVGGEGGGGPRRQERVVLGAQCCVCVFYRPRCRPGHMGSDLNPRVGPLPPPPPSQNLSASGASAGGGVRVQTGTDGGDHPCR